MFLDVVGSIFKVSECIKKRAQTIGLVLGMAKMGLIFANGRGLPTLRPKMQTPGCPMRPQRAALKCGK